MYKNKEGYLDPTAGDAIREADRPPEDLSRAIRLMKFAADCQGFEVIGRIWLRDKKTGMEYK
ncbi:MAG TPA: hypothetical protein H9716_09135 [Candidatus Enterocloster faecavium]|uniref:Uncharacterized protein n=1 Tax=Candidatus Enterocloster faecavium TaxID=2838560 RepID=A0A9D2L8M0_9FIRM|nr:hypothetical protein [Candidatus Enterocloster faecavium]